MKLRNKKTGKIVEIASINRDYDGANDIGLVKAGQPRGKTIPVYSYHSLAEINEEWEDYEEPKEYWAIDCFSPDGELVSQFSKCSERIIENRKRIGNYFETKEEAEKAVRKLKAWKRLKDKGVRFNRWTISEEPKTPHIKLVIEAEMDVPDSPYGLDLLFSEVKNE